MNWEQFRKNIGMRFQVEPIACRLDEHGNELPVENDDWILDSISAENVLRLSNIRTGHVAELGKDHIYDFRSNPGRSQSGLRYGFLVLKVQIFISGNRLWLRPNSKPCERVNPHHTPDTRSNPPEGVLRILAQLLQSGWGGTPESFNKQAAKELYGEAFAEFLPEPPDYFSAVVISGYAMITSSTDHGNRPDGTPDTTISLALTPGGKDALAKWQSNQAFLRTASRPLGHH